MLLRVSLVVQMVKNLSAMGEIQIQSLGWENPLEKEMATPSSILAWRTAWKEEPGELQFMGSQSIKHDLATNTHTHNASEEQSAASGHKHSINSGVTTVTKNSTVSRAQLTTALHVDTLTIPTFKLRNQSTVRWSKRFKERGHWGVEYTGLSPRPMAFVFLLKTRAHGIDGAEPSRLPRGMPSVVGDTDEHPVPGVQPTALSFTPQTLSEKAGVSLPLF